VICPLCGGVGATPFHRDPNRDYLRCATCLLVFVPPEQRPSPERERAEYDLHDNRLDDPAYRRFLSRVFTPMQQRLPPGSLGLDFGCGPAPALVAMFEEGGHTMARFDAFYFPGLAPLSSTYDFITATEVIEHLHHPGAELERLWSLLRPGGCLGLMTQPVLDRARFKSWRYIQDVTHVCFFSQATFAWLGMRWGVVPEFVGRDVVLFSKPGGAA